MNPLEENIQSFIVHKYEKKDKKGKLIEAAIYSLDEADIKFRIIKFINGSFKEIATSEKKEEALETFEKFLR